MYLPYLFNTQIYIYLYFYFYSNALYNKLISNKGFCNLFLNGLAITRSPSFPILDIINQFHTQLWPFGWPTLKLFWSYFFTHTKVLNIEQVTIFYAAQHEVCRKKFVYHILRLFPPPPRSCPKFTLDFSLSAHSYQSQLGLKGIFSPSSSGENEVRRN